LELVIVIQRKARARVSNALSPERKSVMTPFQDQPEGKNLSPAAFSTIPMWNGHPVRFDPVTQRLFATDMWKATGGEKRNQPASWLRYQGAQGLAQEITQGANSHLESGTGFEPYVTIHGGPNAGTWMCVELALAYAEFLDPKFWLWVLRTFVQARTGQLVPVAQTPAVDLAPVMAKLDSLAARAALMKSLSASPKAIKSLLA
jgi:hypothetical protein